jgi:uncharacterized membrane protein YeaQ/YmgE (transglycosylase-associated protein family)
LSAEVLAVKGGAAAGKTNALAAIAADRAARGKVLVVCSHAASRRTFDRALAASRGTVSSIVVDTLAGHLARMMRAEYASVGISPRFVAGGAAAGQALVERAARGLLDLAWPELRDGTLDLDLPFARRPGALLEAAGALFELLRRTRITAAEFGAGCVAGLHAFYGDDVERARDLLNQAQRTRRGSKRAREAMLATEAGLRSQLRAERDLARILDHLYRDYITVARASTVKPESEIIGSGMDWLSSDAGAAAAAFAGFDAVLVDDAEDAEPALAEFLAIAAAAGVGYLAIAGRDESAIDELHGRRALFVPPDAQVVVIGPPPPPPKPEGHRFIGEIEESDWIAHRIADLLGAGSRPDEIAILSRDRDAALIYAGLLAARGLPALPPPNEYAAPDDIADLFALAHIVEDPYDQARLLRVLASPLVGFSDATLWTLCGDASGAAQLPLDVGGGEQTRGRDRGAVRTLLTDNVLYGGADRALPEPAREVLRRFRDRLSKWRATCAVLSPSDAFALLTRDAGFASRWRAGPQFAASRVADDSARIVEALESAVSSGVARSLRAAIAAVEGRLIEPRPAARSTTGIICDGIVDVKGERFDHVVVAGVAHERFPRIYVSRAMAFSRKYGLIVRDNVADGAAQTAKFAWYYAKFEAKRRYLDGERRALRYGLSRGVSSAAVTGYGTPPHWAKDEDLLAEYLPTRL